MNAFLILEDGHVFKGKSFGAQKEVICEVVFNTSMTGYLEVLTDPSYQGQGVVMTYPLIGNYGVCLEDAESDRPWHSAFIVREISRMSSNFRREEELEAYLKEHDIPGICGVDTRAITKILREDGCMGGMVTTNPDYNLDEILPKLKAYRVTNAVKTVTRKEKTHVAGDGPKVALLDLGTKKNIIRSLSKRGCDVTVYPAFTSAEEILGDQPDGIMLSNGPGDPKECTEIIKEIKKLYDSDVPIFAICLGHQLMALATGADTEKMRWGHRGGNHPVKDLATGRVYISSQNHGYVIKNESIPKDVAEVSFINVNDRTIEGLNYKNKKIRTVQFHPEACPGPQDTAYLFDEFLDVMKGAKNA
ncbi:MULTISPECIES: carbamoyl phosphate synthase small subunit [Anaerostipes]|uniref:Carbamoyl phosphate synthase small chain n=1 Tax=Anaerostipes butyraticus TaxID=645466 RepID=A0A916Q648_9FIRM|nr:MULTISPECIES: carbamoyl phosphate synthase small subunit [Anaerostipes]GFO85062.1 carbamoyl-phosphate synthase small chain [Anaerostipes butyraticus]HJC83252.1 carbamoyl phosphate synthase small subunit [Candidatus Anaerostipes avicola]